MTSSLLDLEVKIKNVDKMIQKINLQDFYSYWENSVSILLLYDEKSKTFLADYKQLLMRSNMENLVEFAMDVTNVPDWSSLNTPVIIYRNSNKNLFTIDDFNNFGWTNNFSSLFPLTKG